MGIVYIPHSSDKTPTSHKKKYSRKKPMRKGKEVKEHQKEKG
jgi:hypothetical protein